MEPFFKLFEILGSLGLFFFGLKVLSEAILQLKGERMRSAIRLMTKNRIGGIFTGFFITALIQSSSATTVLVVSFVHVRLMKLKEAIGVIMGANLGTTVTFWVVALLGLKFKISILIMPAIALSIPFLFSSNKRRAKWGEILISFGLVFLGLDLLKQAVPDIQHNPEAVHFLTAFTGYGYASYLLFVVVGIVMTVILQSSSAAGAITLIMAYRGWIDFPTAAAVIMGENIGTTITAYLAALNFSVEAKRAARAHFLFNVIGLAWMLVAFPWFLDLVDWLVPGQVTDRTALQFHLAAFHSLFKLVNICLLVSFVGQLARFAEWAVPDRKDQEPEEEMILEKAEQRIEEMINLIDEMFHDYRHALANPGTPVNPDLEQTKKKEYLIDRIQEEMSQGLIHHAFGLVAQQVVLALVDLRILDQLESIADRIVELMRRLEKRERRELTLPKEFEEHLRLASEETEALLHGVKKALTGERERELEAHMDLFEKEHPRGRDLPQEYEWSSDTAKRLGVNLWKNLYKIEESCRVIYLTLSEERRAG